jgi:drug/metabolite transporter (DMT)-like permease
MNISLFGLGSLLTAGLLFGSFGIWVRLLSSDLSSYQQIAFRNIVALIIAVTIIYFRKIKLSFKGVNPKYLILFGISFPIGVIFYTFSMLNTSIMLGIFSFYLGSIPFLLLLGMILFKEKLTPQKIISLLFSALGILLFYPAKWDNTSRQRDDVWHRGRVI